MPLEIHMHSETIAGVRVDICNLEEAIQNVSNYLGSGKVNVIYTPNPEMIVDTVKDVDFRNILNSGNLNICDGKGLQLVSHGRLKRVPGVDLTLSICQLAAKSSKSIYLLGTADQAVVTEAARRLRLQFPNLTVVGFDKGPVITIDRQTKKIKLDSDLNDSIILRINAVKPDILFVAFGHNKQEKWLHENLSKFTTVRVAMGVGGSIDYIAGRTQRAPLFMQKLGLEWLWRLIREPRRIKRIYRATILFIYYYVKSKRENKIAQAQPEKI